MPELLEIETYRKAAEPIVGRTVAVVDAPDDWYLKGGLGPPEVVSVLLGVRSTGVSMARVMSSPSSFRFLFLYSAIRAALSLRSAAASFSPSSGISSSIVTLLALSTSPALSTLASADH